MYGIRLFSGWVEGEESVCKWGQYFCEGNNNSHYIFTYKLCQQFLDFSLIFANFMFFNSLKSNLQRVKCWDFSRDFLFRKILYHLNTKKALFGHWSNIINLKFPSAPWFSIRRVVTKREVDVKFSDFSLDWRRSNNNPTKFNSLK